MRRSLIAAVVALFVVSLSCLAGVVTLVVTRGGQPPSAFAGRASLRGRIECASPGARDVATLEARLAGLGIDGTVTRVDASSLDLTLRSVAGPEVLRALVAPRRLAMSSVLDARADMALPPGVSRRAVGGGEAYFASSPAELGPLSAWAPEGDARLVIGCAPSVSGTECEGAFVRASPEITNQHVEHAEVVIDELTGMPMVAVELTRDGALAFAALTRSLTGRRLAIVLDDRLVSAPVVIEAITGGRAVITLGGDGPREALEAEARALAVALDVGDALGCAYEIQSLDVAQ